MIAYRERTWSFVIIQSGNSPESAPRRDHNRTAAGSIVRNETSPIGARTARAPTYDSAGTNARRLHNAGSSAGSSIELQPGDFTRTAADREAVQVAA